MSDRREFFRFKQQIAALQAQSKENTSVLIELFKYCGFVRQDALQTQDRLRNFRLQVEAARQAKEEHWTRLAPLREEYQSALLSAQTQSEKTIAVQRKIENLRGAIRRKEELRLELEHKLSAKLETLNELDAEERARRAEIANSSAYLEELHLGLKSKMKKNADLKVACEEIQNAIKSFKER